MATILLKKINKVYDSGVQAVFDADLAIQDGEFLTIVGPSGAGKSSVLRMIAGLESITSGELYIGDTLVNEIDAKDRDLAMVFQNFPLYAHMTVFDNMAFGLRSREVPKDVIDERMYSAAEILGIKDCLPRKPKTLTGGEKQRVALGRAVVREPKAILFDEPLSNLDVKLKYSMRSDIVKMQARMQTTFVYVTSEQAEAMSLGTRVAVMKDGFIQQVDTPNNLYDYPINAFVASYIGGMSLIKNATLEQEEDGVYVHFEKDNKCLLPTTLVARISNLNAYLGTGKAVTLGVHAEDVTLSPEGEIKCTVAEIKKQGEELFVACDLSEKVHPILLRVPEETQISVKEEVQLSLNSQYLQLFDGETEYSLLSRDEGYEKNDLEDSKWIPPTPQEMKSRMEDTQKKVKKKK